MIRSSDEATPDVKDHVNSAWFEVAQQVIARCQQLAELTEIQGQLTRRYLTDQHRATNKQVATWMQQAGMTSWQDTVGNVWGRYEGKVPGAKALVLGSHLDTVPDAGKYDGILGVLLAIAVIEHCNEHNIQFPYAIEVVGFCDEEGARFGTTLIGSKAVAGQWNDRWFGLKDVDEVLLVDALTDWGLDPARVGESARSPDELLGYWEVHIEQGPVLESLALSVGVVTGIAGARRANLRLTGKAGHAGTTPMHLRRDALVGAAELTIAIEQIAKQAGQDVVATVGQLFARPGAVNVIAGASILSLDVRSQDDKLRNAVLSDINDAAEMIAANRHLYLGWEWIHSAKAVMCDGNFTQLLSEAIDAHDYPVHQLPSGAGHDAMAMAAICPVAMLFIRSPAGLSHHPDETVIVDDVALSLSVMFEALKRF